jgi:hypothetical protein
MTESERAINEYLARGGKVVRVLPGSYPLEADAPAPDGATPATPAGFSGISQIERVLQKACAPGSLASHGS